MADRTDIAAELNALAIHCPPRLMEVEARALWLRDWCEDLATFPIEAIRTACRKYRNSGATKFPTPGHLVPMVKAESQQETRGPAETPWRELTDVEYQALSVREKIRHHQILSHSAYLKAGPMFRNTSAGGPISKASGVYLTLADMPAEYHKWVDVAKHHSAEARRLRSHMTSKTQVQAAE